MKTECEEIIESLPHHPFTYETCHSAKPNAYVFRNEEGEVTIIPTDGGAIWAYQKNFVGDAAPWCD